MSQGEPAPLQLDILDGNIGLLTIGRPESKAITLGQATQAELEKMAAELGRRGDLQGLVFRSGKPGMFIAGADLNELGSARPDPEQTRRLVRRGLDLIAAFEALPYPTVAAIDGACMGGGLELALGFDFRLASTHPKTVLGFPEVNVGLFPGWGGTQRTSRLIGPSLTAEMVTTGEALKPEKARQYGLIFDAVPGERLAEEALRLLRWARETEAWKEARRRKQQPVGLSEEQLTFAMAVARGQVMAATRGRFPAPLAAIDVIAKGCNLPLPDGLAVETEHFIPLVGSPVSRAMIAQFFINQRLQKYSGVDNDKVKPREVKLVGVVGAGLMGAGIAGAHVRRGVPVLLLDSSPAALEKGVAANVKVMQTRVEIGRMTQQEVVAALARLSTTLTLPAFADRDLVIEAIVEDENAKTQLYRQLQDVLRPDAILASNTSTISITRMAKAVKNPGNFAGLHFFNPVDRMQLVEVIRGDQTSDETVVTLVALARRIGKTPIVVRDCPGFLVNRILFPYMNEAMALLEEGATPRDIDRAATAFGMPMGPVLLQDVVGLDTSLHAGRVVNTAFADRAVTTRIVDELVAARRLGQKSGAGFYSYPRGPKPVDDPALESFLGKVRRQTRLFTQEEITDRLFLPMLTEASRVLSEGIVHEPGDVDMGLILGIGFPRFRGGILRWADDVGLPKVLEKLKKYEPLGSRFQPTEQMKQLAAAGKGFYPS